MTPTELRNDFQKQFNLHFEVWGPVHESRMSDTLVLCMHGIESHSLWFEDIADGLCEQGFYVCSWDRQGWGQSEGVRGHLNNPDDLCELLSQIIKTSKKNFSKIHLVAQSWGGMIGCYFAYKHSDLISSMTLIAPGVFPKVKFNHDFVLKVLKNLIRKNYDPIDLPLQTDLFTLDPDVHAYIEQDPYRNTKVSAKTAYYTSILQKKVRRGLLDNAKQFPKTQLILAEFDDIIDTKRTKEFFDPVADMSVVLRGAGHALGLEQPQEVSFLISKFLRELNDAV